MKTYLRVRQQYPPVLCTHDARGDVCPESITGALSSTLCGANNECAAGCPDHLLCVDKHFVNTGSSSFFSLTSRVLSACPQPLGTSKKESVRVAPIDAGSYASWTGRRRIPCVKRW